MQFNKDLLNLCPHTVMSDNEEPVPSLIKAINELTTSIKDIAESFLKDIFKNNHEARNNNPMGKGSRVKPLYQNFIFIFFI